MATEMEFGLLGAIIVRGNGAVPPGQSKATNDTASLCSLHAERTA
jgi:hypothetical protein